MTRRAKGKILILKQKRENFDLVDQDYLHLLSPEETLFLATFLEDFYEGRGSGRYSRQSDLMYADPPPPPTQPRKYQSSYSASDWTDGGYPDPETVLLLEEEISSRLPRKTGH